MRYLMMIGLCLIMGCTAAHNASAVASAVVSADNARSLAYRYATAECDRLGYADEGGVSCRYEVTSGLLRAADLVGCEPAPIGNVVDECLGSDSPITEGKCIDALRSVSGQACLYSMDTSPYPDPWAPEGCTQTGVCMDTGWDASGGFGGGAGAGGSSCQTCEGWTSSCGQQQPPACYARDWIDCVLAALRGIGSVGTCVDVLPTTSCTSGFRTACRPEEGRDFTCNDHGHCEERPDAECRYPSDYAGSSTRHRWERGDHPGSRWERARRCPGQ